MYLNLPSSSRLIYKNIRTVERSFVKAGRRFGLGFTKSRTDGEIQNYISDQQRQRRRRVESVADALFGDNLIESFAAEPGIFGV